MQQESLSIFEPAALQSSETIFVHGIRSEIKAICTELGGVTQTSRLLNLNFRQVCEWPWRGKPIPLHELDKMLKLLPIEKQEKFRTRIESSEIRLSAQYSAHKVKFPTRLTPELCYIVGLLLGDGSISAGRSNGKRCWQVQVFFDNSEHAFVYQAFFHSCFDLSLKTYPKRGCNSLCSNSHVVHWFFRTFFGLHQGKKADKIVISERILTTNNPTFINACIRGLFDSDGSVIPSTRCISYASTSSLVVGQVQCLLESQGIHCSRHQWLKDPKFKMLYSLRIQTRRGLESFQRLIGFFHPMKNTKLLNILGQEFIKPVLQSPVV